MSRTIIFVLLYEKHEICMRHQIAPIEKRFEFLVIAHAKRIMPHRFQWFISLNIFIVKDVLDKTDHNMYLNILST